MTRFAVRIFEDISHSVPAAAVQKDHAESWIFTTLSQRTFVGRIVILQQEGRRYEIQP